MVKITVKAVCEVLYMT